MGQITIGPSWVKDDSGNYALTWTAVASAVNYPDLANAAAGSGPVLSAKGADTNIPFTVKGKGTGVVILGQATCAGVQLAADQSLLDSSGLPLLAFTKVATAVNRVNAANAAAGNGPGLSVTGSDTDIDFLLSIKGAGKIKVNGPIVGNAVAVSRGRNSKVHPDTSSYTSLSTEYNNGILEFTGALGAGRDVVLPNTDGAQFIVYNGTTGGFALTFKVSGQTGVAIGAGKRAMIYCNGVDFVRVTPDT